MTRDDIIRMAREAGWTSYDSQDERFERFAALVATKEREAWQDTVKKILVEVKKSDERYMNLFKINNELIELIQKAKSQEREKCAKLLEDFARFGDTRDCIAAIRARGQE